MAEVDNTPPVAGDAPPVVADPGVGLGTPPPSNSGLGGPPPVDPNPAIADIVPPKVEPPPTKAAPKAPTIADTPPVDDKTPKATAPADWPEDWRARLAGDNKKAADRLARFKSPNDVLNSYLALEAKVSGGEFAKKLPTNYTDAELADYRKANGIPDKPDDYKVDVPGLVWGEADKPMLDSWKQFAFENNLPPEIAKMGPAWYAREQEALVARLAEQDQVNYQSGTAALQAEWGNEFKGNINAAKNLFEAYPGVWDSVMGARDADGVRNGDNPVVLKALASIAKEMNPYATIIPNVPSQNAAQTLAEEKSQIKSLMGDKGSEYWRGPKAAVLQARYREILDLESRVASRGGRAA